MPKKCRFIYKKGVSKDLYEIGFKRDYVKCLISTFSDEVWSWYDKDAYLSFHHVTDDIIVNIDIDIDTVLQNMRPKYKKLYTTITNDIREYYSNLHLVQIIIEYSYGRLDPISTEEFLYNPEIKNQWFLNKNQILCFNAPTKNDVVGAINLLEIEPGFQLFYHATNWKHLENIVKRGPKSSMERRGVDFGIHQAFYLTPDIDLAIKWASRASFNNEGGIAVFSLNVKDLNNIMIFETADDKWKALVKESRIGKRHTNSLDKCNFVYGPMLENVCDITKPDVEAKAHSPIRWQLASKNDISDKILKDLMVGAIWHGRQFEMQDFKNSVTNV